MAGKNKTAAATENETKPDRSAVWSTEPNRQPGRWLSDPSTVPIWTRWLLFAQPLPL